MVDYKVTDVRLEPLYALVKKSPTAPALGPTPFEIAAKFRTELEKEVNADYVRHQVLGNPVFQSMPDDNVIAGGDAVAHVLHCLNSLRDTTVGNGPQAGSKINVLTQRYLEFPGGVHQKVGYAVSGVNGTSSQWKVANLQFKDANGNLEYEFECSIAISIAFEPVVKPTAGP